MYDVQTLSTPDTVYVAKDVKMSFASGTVYVVGEVLTSSTPDTVYAVRPKFTPDSVYVVRLNSHQILYLL